MRSPRSGTPPFLARKRIGLVVALVATLGAVWAWHHTSWAAKEKTGGAAKKTALSTGLGLIPPDAVGFVHLRLADLGGNDLVKALRHHFPREFTGLQTLTKKSLNLALTDIESATLVFPSLSSVVYIPWMLAPRRGIPKTSPAEVRPSSDKVKSSEDKPKKEKSSEDKPKKEKPEDRKKEKPAEDKPKKEKPAEPFANDKAGGAEEAGADLLAPPFLILTTVKALDRDKLLKALSPDAQEKKHKGKTYYLLRSGGKSRQESRGKVDDKKEEKGSAGESPNTAAVCFLTRRTLVLAAASQLRQLLEQPARTETKGPLSRALKLAAQKHQLVVGLALTGKAAREFRELGERELWRDGGTDPVGRVLRPLAELRSLVASLDLGEESRAELQLGFGTEARAKKAVGAVQDGLMLLRVFGVGGLLMASDEVLAEADDSRAQQAAMFGKLLVRKTGSALRSAKVEQRGSSVHVALHAATDPEVLARQTTAALKAWKGDDKAMLVRRRRKVTNSLRQIGIAMHNYNDAYRHLPTAAIYDKNGKPLLSWRVAILPFVEQDQLYKQFKLDEPWDSDHNKKLLAQMPPVYAPVGVKTKEPHTTFYQVFVGKGTPFVGQVPPAIPQTFQDGTSNTLLVVEAGKAVPWTKPEDIPFDIDKPAVPRLGAMFKDRFGALFADAAVRFLKKDIDPKTLTTLITPAGGEVIPAKAFE